MAAGDARTSDRDYEWAVGTLGATVRGATTPSVTIIFIAVSTLMSSSITCSRGTMTIRPDVGFGVVGT
jgi:hypothetical protein